MEEQEKGILLRSIGEKDEEEIFDGDYGSFL
jgi:hypothetical protein